MHTKPNAYRNCLPKVSIIRIGDVYGHIPNPYPLGWPGHARAWLGCSAPRKLWKGLETIGKPAFEPNPGLLQAAARLKPFPFRPIVSFPANSFSRPVERKRVIHVGAMYLARTGLRRGHVGAVLGPCWGHVPYRSFRNHLWFCKRQQKGITAKGAPIIASQCVHRKVYVLPYRFRTPSASGSPPLPDPFPLRRSWAPGICQSQDECVAKCKDMGHYSWRQNN